MTSDRAAPRPGPIEQRDMSWEKEGAPKISRAGVVRWAFVYAAWTVFLGYLACARWFGELQ